ncbi:hypothetical protein KQI67_29375 [Bacillus albus]|uniref:DUF6445 family protein n=1 Tax=Bacillus TaxID=1386 RepID=UPI000BF31B98|nr:DUF6445 family protein [Bacillus albus]PFB74578.1 hypothetical protein CN286_27550 [Bacillus anthracis]MBU5220671.1 hypothetical protein [Bacillus albus]RXJ13550.1 hypothetical protein ETJ91_25020 [Bacillus albus]RXJ23189.1 hypothetical protein ETJ90_25625 [Bacillus albus]RXJ26910.1 hypothetical protein ETJ76_22090 [Bacillus albus]
MHNKIIVIENFYKNPELIRNFALKSNYSSVAKLNYPGYQSDKEFDANGIIEGFERIVGNKIEDPKGRFTFGGFRLITKNTGKVLKVHADTIIDWAGLVFLTPNAPLDSGLGIYKHRETGLIGPPTDEEARQLGHEDASEFEMNVIRRDMDDLSKWELISFIGNKFNRLVLIKGCELYHAPMKGFGENPKNCRITQNFFFKELVKSEPLSKMITI